MNFNLLDGIEDALSYVFVLDDSRLCGLRFEIALIKTNF